MTCLSATAPSTLKYYKQRQQGHADNFPYWSPKEDPEGVVRDRSGEMKQYLSDTVRERLWVEELSGGWVLDVGCGRGWMLHALLGGKWQKHGTEVCPVAREACEEQGINLWDADLRLCPLSERFDAVICHHVIEHVHDPVSMIREIHRLLKPGGRLLMATPDFDSPCAKRFGNRYRMLHDETHVSLFTLESMHRFLRDHGFEIEDVRFPFPIRYATAESMEKWRRGPVEGEWSPPWPGNWMSFYCEKV